MKKIICFFVFLVIFTRTASSQEISSMGRFSWEIDEEDLVVNVQDYKDTEDVWYRIGPDTSSTDNFLVNCTLIKTGRFRKHLEKGIHYEVVLHIFQGDSMVSSTVTGLEIP